MIRLVVQLPSQVSPLEWERPSLSIGRAPNNDLVFPADNVSSMHGQITLAGAGYVYRDLRSTNGTVLIRGEKRYLLKGEASEMALAAGDRICLASLDHEILVEAIEAACDEDDEACESTIIAEEAHRSAADLERDLGDDSSALRSAVELARELHGVAAVHEVAELACRAALKAFLRAQRVVFLVPSEAGGFKTECIVSGEAREEATVGGVLRSRQLLDRCIAERKGFIFIIEQNRMRAVATMVSAAESFSGADAGERIILCCPLFSSERCIGFIEVEAPLGKDRQGLTRRDLSLLTLMGHLVAARLNDLEDQRLRLKLARKATAGYLAATVGHCFKNLLFVPNSLAKLLPMSIARGNVEEVKWMLARNSVNIRYLDILSNEFAAASKDPTAGFEPCSIDALLEEVANLMNQIAPEKVEATLDLPLSMPRMVCHGGALRRLLMNLTLNAVDAFFGADVKEKGLIDLAAAFDAKQEECRITVRDNGPGIPPEILANLREIFRQVQASADALGEIQTIAERVRSTKDQGFKEHYGLGFLFVCQTVNAHGGRLEINSEPGKGARFEITLPQRAAQNGTMAEDEPGD